MKLLHLLNIVFLSILIFSEKTFAQSKINYEDCYSERISSTLMNLGNNSVHLNLEIQNNKISIISLENKNLNEQVKFLKDGSLYSIYNVTDSILDIKINSEIIEETAVSYGYLQVSLETIYPKIDIKTVLKIFSDSPMIGIDYYYKKKDNNLKFSSEQANMVSFNLTSNHWLFKTVEFRDVTDFYNNLVEEHELSLFPNYPQKLTGNILHAKSILDKNSLVILKHAPCSFVQLNYPGYDFHAFNKTLSVTGTGITAKDLQSQEWIKTYSVAVGVSDYEELTFLNILKTYQKKLRKFIPERDEMVMMNTWGDRSQDTSINEKFIIDEIDACLKLNITHFQIDDGWQTGRSAGSGDTTATKLLRHNDWEAEHWIPDPGKFPNGFKYVNDYAKKKGIKLGLWFTPNRMEEYVLWERDANIIIDLYKKYDVRYFKVDGVDIPTKKAEINFRKFLNKISNESNGEVVINLDLTNERRPGYFYFYEYGNVFLENRYSDWGNYYPYWTLRNLWNLSKYVPAEKLQIEFLNNNRSQNRYPQGDVFAPANIPFDYSFAITMMGQPLAWFEGSNLNQEQKTTISPILANYLEIQEEMHKGFIYPIGFEPNGITWTGFQSIIDEDSGFILVFRENNELSSQEIKTYLPENRIVKFKKIMGYGKDFDQITEKGNLITFNIPNINQYVLYKYYIE